MPFARRAFSIISLAGVCFFPPTYALATKVDIPPNSLRFEPAFETQDKNQFQYPLEFAALPGIAGVYAVAERGTGAREGRIWLLEKKGDGWSKSLFLSVPVESSRRQSEERGLLGFVFHPDFADNRRYFINRVPAPSRGSDKDSTYIEERLASADYRSDSGRPPKRILAVEQPYWNHNGGTLAFGPDGFLYIGMGDGGSGGDPQGHGQNLRTLLGAMLRIDVDASVGAAGYAIPPDNPFVGRRDARPEIWAYGLRNPWKFSFDALTGDLWAGDVGQVKREEISIVTSGANMGWAIREGTICHRPSSGCREEGLTPPIVDLRHDEAASITGGYVYRGDTASAYYGYYVFGDYQTRNVWALKRVEGKAPELRKLGRSPGMISSFGVDEAGQIYALGFDDGIVYRLRLPEKEKPAGQ